MIGLKTPIAVGWNPFKRTLKESGFPTYSKPYLEGEGTLITPLDERKYEVLKDDELLLICMRFEEAICHEPVENILVFDKYGNTTMHRIGDIDSVDLNLAYWNEAKVVIHNHPNGSLFSGEDISHFYDSKCPEIRICTDKGWYSLKRGENWNANGHTAAEIKNKIDRDMLKIHTENYREAALKNHLEVKDTIDENGNPFVKVVKPANMTDERFEELKDRAKSDLRHLHDIRGNKYFRDFAEKNNFIYRNGAI